MLFIDHVTKLFKQRATLIAFSLFMLLFVAEPLIAQQYYEFSLRQRRAYDQIHVEIWAKDITDDATTAPKLGNASFVVAYDDSYLDPAPDATQQMYRSTADSIQKNVDDASPIVALTSEYHAANGYSSLNSRDYGTGFYSLEVHLSSLGTGGLIPSSTGRGSFIGKIVFDIIDDTDPNWLDPDNTSLTGIKWSTSSAAPVAVNDVDGEIDIDANSTLTQPADFQLFGITVVSPDFNAQVIDRDLDRSAWMTSDYNGYPIYFERSVDPSDYASGSVVDDDLGFLLEYSTDGGTNWSDIGRVAESDQTASAVSGNIDEYISGDLTPQTGGLYMITSQDGTQLTTTNYRNPVRVVWRPDPYFSERSEQAVVKITQLAKKNSNTLANRQIVSGLTDSSDEDLVLGRLFFVQLDGQNDYFKSPENYENATELTVEAWINLNDAVTYTEDQNPAVVASSGGPDAAPVNGSREGAWMLYLKDGLYPAFRARDILGRSTDGYIADIVAYDALTPVNADAPISQAHADNWTHLAATVKDNIVTLYVNGEIIDKIVNNDDNDIRMSTTNHPIWIGVNPNISIEAGDYLNAGVKSVRVWRTALTQEEIRRRTPGVADPDGSSAAFTAFDVRKGLEYYYTFEGTIADFADDATYQNGQQDADYFTDATSGSESLPYYRPDLPHILLTSPTTGAGVKNQDDDLFEIRWVSYGMGTISGIAPDNTTDIEIEYSLDNGTTWTNAKDPSDLDLGGGNALDVETGKAIWEPFNNDGTQSLYDMSSDYAKTCILRITGEATTHNQEEFMNTSGNFTVAPHFTLKKQKSTIISLPASKSMNLSGNSAYIEFWMAPDRFPTELFDDEGIEIEDGEGFFPIIAKYDSVNNVLHYAIDLLPTGLLRVRVQDSDGTIREAISDSTYPVVEENSVDLNDIWTHVGVYIGMSEGESSSKILFYIDGVAQNSSDITTQLGTNLQVDSYNKYPTYIGYYPGQYDENGDETEAPRGFVGNLREIRFWSSAPNGESTAGNYPTDMTKYIWGAMNVEADELVLTTDNLFTAFTLDGGSFVAEDQSNTDYDSYMRGLGSSINNGAQIARYYGADVTYEAVMPYVKVVEPIFTQEVPKDETELRIRWAGFNYNMLVNAADGFFDGSSSGAGNEPSLEFSIRGGGGDMMQPYIYIASTYMNGSFSESMTYPVDDEYRFNKVTGSPNLFFGAELDVSNANPDADGDGTISGATDQGPLPAALQNARLRLQYKNTFNTTLYSDKDQGELFTITPQSNFTIRLLLEGYHSGTDENMTGVLPTAGTFDEGAVRILLYEENGGSPGDYVTSALSKADYSDKDPSNMGNNGSRFADLSYVFTDIPEGNYWVVVEQLNHLPLRSKEAAPFVFSGDDLDTWTIESGYDFTTWDGTDNSATFPADGDAISDKDDADYSTTGLNYSEGQDAFATPANFIGAMVSGDINRDEVINADDRSIVRTDAANDIKRSDVTGDGLVNALDRDIVDRNYGKIKSVDYTTGSIIPIENGGMIAHAKSKYDKALTTAISYEVIAVVEENENIVDVSFYIKNTGQDFGLGNATFAVKYDPDQLDYKGLVGAQDVIYSNNYDVGYGALYSAPRQNSPQPIRNVRTVEVDYDAYMRPGGINVPYEREYLGTLRFEREEEEYEPQFAWHESCIVLDAYGQNVTGEGVFQPIGGIPEDEYFVTITKPNGGESLSPEINYTVTWTTDGDSDIHLEFSDDGGNSWQAITETPLPADIKSFVWLVPDVTTSMGLIRAIDAETAMELDRSDYYFTIKKQAAYAMINRPASADPVYTGGSHDEIKWSAQGYGRIRFEFSSDAGDTWTTVAQRVESGKDQVAWQLPNITTKAAIVRMINEADDSEITRSGYFKILSGSVEFKTPRLNQSLLVGRMTRIRWIAQNAPIFDLELSVDNGQSWQKLFWNVDGSATYQNWTVPNQPSEEAIIRAIWMGDPEMEYARTDRFNIVPSTSIGDNLPLGYEVSKLYPNPSSDLSTMRLTLPEGDNLHIRIHNQLGQEVAEIANKFFSQGSHFVELSTAKLATGQYFVIITTSQGQAIRRLSVIK